MSFATAVLKGLEKIYWIGHLDFFFFLRLNCKPDKIHLMTWGKKVINALTSKALCGGEFSIKLQPLYS